MHMLDVGRGPTAGAERTAVGGAHLPALDGVRAVAVVGVIASHSGVFGLGWLGVDIFFGLSGYLITGILLDAKAAEPLARGFFVPFYMRRALRILPLAWTAAVVMAFIQNQWSGLIWYVGYLVNWLGQSPPPGELGHYWSLAVEEQFYLLWPALVFFTSRRTLWKVSIAVIAIDVVCRFGFSMWPPAFANAQFLGLATFARADTLAVGAMLAQRERGGGWGRERSWAVPAALFAGVAVVAIRWMELKGLFPLLTYNLKWPVIALGVGGGLLFVLTRPPRLLQWPVVVWVGQISYGIYVIHAFFGRPLHRLFSFAPTIFMLQVALTIPLAAASWYLFESPILKQKWRWPMTSPKSRRTSVVAARSS